MREARTRVGMVDISCTAATPQSRLRYSARNGRPVADLWSPIEPATTFAYLPYSTGLLLAYAKRYARHPQNFEWMTSIVRRLPVAEAVERLGSCAIVGFSVYIWNIRYSLRVAQELKRLHPETLIVFGGPEIPNHTEAFLRSNPFIDVVCNGEGERTFLDILERHAEQPEPRHHQWEGVQSVSFLAADRGFVANPVRPRLQDLDQIPSPYLEGVFEPVMAENPDLHWYTAWETNRGCPFRCSFCDWGSAVGSKIYQFGMSRLEAEADWLARHHIPHIFICDANFGILPRDVEIAEIFARSLERHDARVKVCIQNTKNSTARAYQVQKALAASGRVTFAATVALQSTDRNTLIAIRRDNISLNAFQELQQRHRSDGIATYTDVIVGLPGETYDSFARGISDIIAGGQHDYLNIYNCQVLPNAEMGDPNYQRLHGMRLVSQPLGDMCGEEERVDGVIATASMPESDWVRCWVYAWMTQLLHFNCLLRVPLVVLHGATGVSYRAMVELFTGIDGDRYPVCGSVRNLFVRVAERAQAGGSFTSRREDSPDSNWNPDDHALLDLVAGNKLDLFYKEARELLLESVPGSATILDDCLQVNRAMLCLPAIFEDASVVAGSNILEYYKAQLEGRSVPLVHGEFEHRVSRTQVVWPAFEDWAHYVDRGAGACSQMLYPAETAQEALTVGATG